MLRGTGVDLPDLEHDRGRRGPTRRRRRVAGPTSSPGPPPTRSAEVDRRRGRGRPRRLVRHPLHLGHDRRAQGRGADPRPHAAAWRPTGCAMTGLDRRRPLPDGQPVLPHVRAEGRDPRLRRGRRDDAARAGVRRRPGAGPGRRRAGHRAPRPADALPVDPRPPGRATVTTCRACGSPSPARPTSRSQLIRRVHDELPFSIDRHRLRPDRGRHGERAPRPDDDAEIDRHHGRAAAARLRDPHRRR